MRWLRVFSLSSYFLVPLKLIYFYYATQEIEEVTCWIVETSKCLTQTCSLQTAEFRTVFSYTVLAHI